VGLTGAGPGHPLNPTGAARRTYVPPPVTLGGPTVRVLGVCAELDHGLVPGQADEARKASHSPSWAVSRILACGALEDDSDGCPSHPSAFEPDPGDNRIPRL
jgi:hypothetical protein